ncbi:MAG TPA: hypothetical protein VNF47_28765 [Streptosporangiaceae bacterium]|nr:hypothetical protein [Streptosporangiaceae bacterium]
MTQVEDGPTGTPLRASQPRYWRSDLLTAPYWNRRAETLPRAELDAMNLPKLRSVLRHAHASSRFYRELWSNAGFDPSTVESLEDFQRRAPVTEKADFLRYQVEQPPYGRTLALDEEFLAHHSATSGTSGTPFNIPFSAYDTERYGESWIYGWWALGIRPHDVFYFAFNWGRYAGFWSAYWGARRLGARVVSGGGLSTDEHIETILRERPTVLIATPSFALRIAAQAASNGINLSESSIRFTYHAGEPGPCSLESVRDRLDEAFGATSGELLGVAELDAIAPGCPGRTGVHMNELNSISWSRDPRTGQPCGDGEIGENIVTTFVNNAQPLINYNTHDLVRAYRHEIPCGCGRTWRYLDGVVLGRSDHMVSVRGTNVYPSAVEKCFTESQVQASISRSYCATTTRVIPMRWTSASSRRSPGRWKSDRRSGSPQRPHCAGRSDCGCRWKSSHRALCRALTSRRNEFWTCVPVAANVSWTGHEPRAGTETAGTGTGSAAPGRRANRHSRSISGGEDRGHEPALGQLATGCG